MNKVFKAFLNWVWLRYHVTPHLCPTCEANLQKQKGAYQGDGLKAERAYYKCKCGTESGWEHHFSNQNQHLWHELTYLRNEQE